jgi:DNA invertase Pin-like site-specific DNA recombinase
LKQLLRTALYARTSTHKQDTDLQLSELRDFADRAHYQIIGEFIDEGVSSGRGSRPKLEELMVMARRRQVDVVLVWRFDRFARSTRELMNALEEFRRLNVDFISLREAVDTSTPAGRVLFAMIAAVAEFEREIIRERVRAGVAKARRQGKRLGRPPVYLDVGRARRLREAGRSWQMISKELKAPISTIRSRLAKKTKA